MKKDTKKKSMTSQERGRELRRTHFTLGEGHSRLKFLYLGFRISQFVRIWPSFCKRAVSWEVLGRIVYGWEGYGGVISQGFALFAGECPRPPIFCQNVRHSLSKIQNARKCPPISKISEPGVPRIQFQTRKLGPINENDRKKRIFCKNLLNSNSLGAKCQKKPNEARKLQIWLRWSQKLLLPLQSSIQQTLRQRQAHQDSRRTHGRCPEAQSLKSEPRDRPTGPNVRILEEIQRKRPMCGEAKESSGGLQHRHGPPKVRFQDHELGVSQQEKVQCGPSVSKNEKQAYWNSFYGRN